MSPARSNARRRFLRTLAQRADHLRIGGGHMAYARV
jgi:hypothetical protein